MGVKRVVNMVKNLDNWAEYLIYKIGGKKKDSFLFKLKNGQTVLAPRRILPEFKESFFEEVYFKNLPSQLEDTYNPNVLDIGANVGYFSLCTILKLNKPHIYAYEPIKGNYQLLQQNIDRAPYDGLRLYNMAVSNLPGDITLRFSEDDITTSASLLSNATGTHEEVVKCTTLEDIMRENKLRKIDLLKMDCEGAEYNILYNTTPELYAKINCIALETHAGSGEKENHDALLAFLKSAGYQTKTSNGNFIWAYKEPTEWVLHPINDR